MGRAFIVGVLYALCLVMYLIVDRRSRAADANPEPQWTRDTHRSGGENLC